MSVKEKVMSTQDDELRKHNSLDSAFTEALMKEHPEWSMENIREASLICSNIAKAEVLRAIPQPIYYTGDEILGVRIAIGATENPKFVRPAEIDAYNQAITDITEALGLTSRGGSNVG